MSSAIAGPADALPAAVQPAATQPAAPPARQSGHLAQLDGLRGLAIISVVWSHLGQMGAPLADFDAGLFLLLSSFLISRQIFELGPDRRTFRNFINFHARRTLRIWPVYLAALALVLGFDMDEARESGWWHALFATNFWFLAINDYRPWPTTAWWQLAMQEQFYVAVSLLFFLVPWRRIPWALVAAFAVSPALFAMTSVVPCGGDVVTCEVMLPAWSSHYAAGALLALAMTAKWPRLYLLWPLAAVSILLEFLPGKGALLNSIIRPIALAALVYGAALGLPGIAGRILGSGALRGLGRISLGVFLYHIPVWWLLTQIWPDPRAYERGVPLFVVGFIASVAVSAASWLLFEKRILALKRHFPFP